MSEPILVSATELRSALAYVKHATGNGERPILATVVIDSDDKRIRLFAADNYRVAERILDVKERGSWRGRAMLYADDVAFLLAWLKVTRAMVTIEFDEDPPTVRFSGTLGSISLRLMDGHYPDVDQVFALSGGEITFAFNAKFVAEMCQAFGGEIVQVRVRDALSPVLFEPISGNRRELVMPVKTMAITDQLSGRPAEPAA